MTFLIFEEREVKLWKQLLIYLFIIRKRLKVQKVFPFGHHKPYLKKKKKKKSKYFAHFIEGRVNCSKSPAVWNSLHWHDPAHPALLHYLTPPHLWRFNSKYISYMKCLLHTAPLPQHPTTPIPGHSFLYTLLIHASTSFLKLSSEFSLFENAKYLMVGNLPHFYLILIPSCSVWHIIGDKLIHVTWIHRLMDKKNTIFSLYVYFIYVYVHTHTTHTRTYILYIIIITYKFIKSIQ